MNLGRLRVASKGVDRELSSGGNGTGPDAGLRRRAVPPRDVHDRPGRRAARVRSRPSRNCTPTFVAIATCLTWNSALNPRRTSEPEAPPPCDVAIIGLSCFYPKAGGLWQYWENILAKVNAVIEIPPTHWDWRLYYDPDPRARDKMVSKWGGFMDDVVFDPLKYGITPEEHPEHRAAATAAARSGEPGARRRGLPRPPVQPRAHLRDPRRGRRRDAAVGRLRVPGLHAAGRFDPRRPDQVAADHRPRRRAFCRSGPRTRSPASC